MTTTHEIPALESRHRVLAGAPVAERRLDVAGVSTAVLDGGDGPPVVLLHGPGAYGAAWLPVIPALLESHRVIAPDLPGQGASIVAGDPLDAYGVLDWLGELLGQLCREPAVLVGQLFGGAIAARFAADHAAALDRLVLVVPFGLAPFQPTPAFGAALMSHLAGPSGDTHDELWKHCVAELDGLRSRLGSLWDAMRQYNVDLAGTPEVAQGQDNLMRLFGMPAIDPAVLGRIAVPTTLIWGRHDTIVPMSIGQEASERYGWPLRMLDAGNEPAMEAPEAFLRAAFDRTEPGE